MGQALSYGLNQDDVEEVSKYCKEALTHSEILSLYRRFRSLDRGRKGYITAEEFINIPELSINPLAQRLVRLFEGVNFKEFCRLLAPFSKNATKEMKIQSIFLVFDVDRDGIISKEDLDIVLRQIVGFSFSDEEVSEIIEKCLGEANALNQSLTLKFFEDVFRDQELNMNVEFPEELF